MDIDLELYKIFFIVAQNKNMTKASEELFISQPAISQSIKKLETQLGGTLFVRSNKGMILTKEGEMFFEYVKGALNLIKNAENEFSCFKDLSAGQIKIGASTTLTKIFLMDTIKEFHKSYPRIDINITNDITSNLLLDLQKGKLDFVVCNEGVAKDDKLDFKVIKTIKQGFLYNPKYFSDSINNLSDLCNIPTVLQKKESNSRKFLDKYLLEKNIVLAPKTEVVSQDLLLEFVDAGFGVGFGIVEYSKKYPNLKELKINKILPTTNVYLATSKHTKLSIASKKFLEMLNK